MLIYGAVETKFTIYNYFSGMAFFVHTEENRLYLDGFACS